MATKEEQKPPESLVALCDKMTCDFFTSIPWNCEPYLQTGEWGDEWRVRIIHRITRQVLVQYITEEGAYGHTLYLLTEAALREYERGVQDGKMQAVKTYMQEKLKLLGIRYEDFKNMLN